jgi:hypothetical protein
LDEAFGNGLDVEAQNLAPSLPWLDSIGFLSLGVHAKAGVRDSSGDTTHDLVARIAVAAGTNREMSWILQRVQHAAVYRYLSGKSQNCYTDWSIVTFYYHLQISVSCLMHNNCQLLSLPYIMMSWAQWPRGLRHELSSPAQTLGSWVRIPLWHRCLCVFILCLYYPVCR